MDLSTAARIRLEPIDEYMHPVETAHNFNESMYVNCFDHGRRMGGWFRVGNRPNEGRAEMSCCVYLPDGRVAFMYRRPAIHGNDALDAGGLRFDVVEPFERLRVRYDGDVCVLADPQDMAEPKRAFADNPTERCRMDLELRGVSPMFGGERVDERGQPIEEPPDESFARAHYEQHIAATGTIAIGVERFELASALGLRDHSWGPRYWQNLHWYRWLPMSFSDDFAMNVSVVTLASGTQHVWGMVLRRGTDGRKQYVPIETAEVTSQYDDRHQATAQIVRASTAERVYEVRGTALATIPLRNRRRAPDGRQLHTRITEAMTRYECDGVVGMGMAEYLDQIEHGQPVGRAC